MILTKFPKFNIVIAIIITAWLSSRWFFSIDTTRQKSNSLSDATVELIKRINGPVTVKAFVADFNNKTNKKVRPAAEVRKIIQQFFARFKSIKPDIKLELIDHKQDVKTATQYGVISSQAVIIEYNGKSTALKRLDQFSFAYTLLQLKNGRQSWLVFTKGHGERSPHQKGNLGLADIADRLRLRSNNIQTLNMNKNFEIPRNTEILVIASPVKSFSLKALGSLMRYINQGGNLLWLHDPHNKSGLGLIANKLGVNISPGLIFDLNHKQKKTWAIILKKFPPHILTQKLNGHLLLFPQASTLTYKKNSSFKISPLLISRQSSWNETSINKKQTLQYDAGSQDRKGPLTLGISLTRTLARNNKQQRIIVIGDSDFLSNGYIERGENLSLAMNIFSWLGQRDELIDVDKPKNSDHLLRMSPFLVLILFVLFSIILPVLFIVIGLVRYRQRLQRE